MGGDGLADQGLVGRGHQRYASSGQRPTRSVDAKGAGGWQEGDHSQSQAHHQETGGNRGPLAGFV